LYVVLDGPAAAEVIPTELPLGHPTTVARARYRLAEIAEQHARVRPELEARGARIVGEFSRVGNAFQVVVPQRVAASLARLPEVERIELVPTHWRTLHSALPTVGATTAWTVAPGYQGEGVRLGIIDSGIDYMHSDFGGSGVKADYEANNPTFIEPGSFPTARVVGGWDFAGNDYNASDWENMMPVPDPDPLDCPWGHGSHVAGIAAGGGVFFDGAPYTGPYDQSFDPAELLIAPGVAPLAQIYSFKVFGCNGSTQLTALAIERAADPNQNGDFSDRLDVVNASLGSAYALQSGYTRNALENLTNLGCLFVAASGNDGWTFFASGTPAAFPGALSVGATADTDLISLTVTAPSSIAGDYPAAEAWFTAKLSQTGPVSGPLVHTEPHDGCEEIENAAQVAGNIALIDRGSCYFVDKFANAEAAGAAAVVVIDHTLGSTPWTMGGGDPGDSPLPGVLIRRVDGELIKAELDSGYTVTATLDGSKRYEGLDAETMASLSGRGPSSADYLLKPEIAAPGLNMDSANAGSGFEPRRTQGTSMATPMVAGAAALVRQANPLLSPRKLKALLMNTAVTLADGDGNPYSVTMQGAGRLDVGAAVSRRVTATNDATDGTVAVTFGAVIAAEAQTVTREVQVHNFGYADIDYAATVERAYPTRGVTLSVEPESFVIQAGHSTTLTLTLQFDPAALGASEPDPITPQWQYELSRHFVSELSGHLRLTDQAEPATESISLPIFGVLRAAAQRQVSTVQGCPNTQNTPAPKIFLSEDSAHPKPVVSAFELGLIDEEDPLSGTDPDVALYDLRALGVASNYGSAQQFDDTSVYFGVAIAGQWRTAAEGPNSLIAVLIDTNEDEEPDYEIRIEPWSQSGPFTDVLVATTYDRFTGAAVADKRFVNIVPAGELDTQPFNNSVLVLSTFARNIGLSKKQPTFRYAARTAFLLNPDLGEQTEWVDYDLTTPRVDTASGAPTPGRPLYVGNEPVVATLGSEANDGQPVEVLLLHHTNVADQRFEVVDVSDFDTEQVALSHSFPATASPAARVVGKLVVRNESSLPLEQVKLTGSITGAGIELVAPSSGTCTKAGTINCDFAALGPGSSVTITVVLNTIASATAVELTTKLTSGAGCETTMNAEFDLLSSETQTATELEGTGGCACRLGSASGPRGLSLWWLAVAMALGFVRRNGRGRRHNPVG